MKEVLISLNKLIRESGSVLNCVEEIYSLRQTLVEDEDITLFVNKVREKVQREAMWAVIDNGGRGLVVMATGAGKSKVAVDLAKYYHEAGKHFDGHCLVVPTEKLRDENWSEEFTKWKAEEVSDKTEKFCYASASKIEDYNFNLAILDEAHNITELSAELFANNHVENVIALTATEPEDEEKQMILQRLGIHLVYKVTLDDAVKLGFVAPYKITVVHTKLDSTDKYIQAGSKSKPFMQTELANYNYLSNLCMIRPGQVSTFNRMRFIYNLRSKTQAAKFILDNLIPEDDRTLIFCGSIAKAEELCENTFHSKSSSKAFDAFKADRIKRLSCVKALNEGQNIIGLDSALVDQINSKEKDIIQRIGRIIRFRPNHEAHIWIIVCNGTQDMVWAANALQNLDQDKIEHIEFETLKKNYYGDNSQNV